MSTVKKMRGMVCQFFVKKMKKINWEELNQGIVFKSILINQANLKGGLFFVLNNCICGELGAQ